MRLKYRFLHKVEKICKAYSDRDMRDKVVNGHHDIMQISEDMADFRKYGFSNAESMNYDLKHNDYHDYISTWESYLPRIKNSLKKYFPISDDKYLFYLVFSHYIKTAECYALIREGKITWLREEEGGLYDAIVSHKGMVIKDRSGNDGFDVYVFRVDDGQVYYKGEAVTEQRLSEIVSSCKNALVQERLYQGQFENALFDKSINTLRIITIRKKNSVEHEVIAAVQRIGTERSYPVDNFSQGGGSCLIDIETGELGPMATLFSRDENGNQQYYDYHPDSGAQLKGIVIPNWQKIKSQLVELTVKLPFFEYVAWDVVLQDEGIAVVETNMKSSMNPFQIHKPLRNSIIGERYSEKGWLVDMD